MVMISSGGPDDLPSQILKQKGTKYQLSVPTPVRAFLIRTPFMRFPHKHPSIYETGGGFRRPVGELDSWMTGKHLHPLSADLSTADQPKSGSLWTAAIMCLGLGLGMGLLWGG